MISRIWAFALACLAGLFYAGAVRLEGLSLGALLGAVGGGLAFQEFIIRRATATPESIGRLRILLLLCPPTWMLSWALVGLAGILQVLFGGLLLGSAVSCARLPRDSQNR